MKKNTINIFFYDYITPLLTTKVIINWTLLVPEGEVMRITHMALGVGSITSLSTSDLNQLLLKMIILIFLTLTNYIEKL